MELVEPAVERRDAEQDRRLVERALDETQGGAHGVAGAEETLAALEEGRVEHLIVDDARGSPLPVMGVGVAEDGKRAGSVGVPWPPVPGSPQSPETRRSPRAYAPLANMVAMSA